MIYYDEEDVKQDTKRTLTIIIVSMLAGFGLGMFFAGLALELYGKGYF